MKTQAILAYKVSFIGMINTEYIHIVVDGKGVVVNPIDRKQSKLLRENNDLVLAKPEDYLGGYDHDGKIYTDENFQKIVNSDPQIKEIILNLIQQYE